MKQLISVCLAFVFAIPSWAFDVALQFGAAHSELVDSPPSSVSDGFSYHYGLAGKWDLNHQFLLRTGVQYTVRSYQVAVFSGVPVTQTDSVDIEFGYIDVPLLFQFQPMSWFGVYAGPVAAFQISDDNVDDVDSTYMLGQGGLHFDFGYVAMDLFYEKGITGTFTDRDDNFQRIGINVLIWTKRNSRLGPAPDDRHTGKSGVRRG